MMKMIQKRSEMPDGGFTTIHALLQAPRTEHAHTLPVRAGVDDLGHLGVEKFEPEALE